MNQIPTREQILAWLSENPGAGKRDIAHAFGVKGAARIDLKRILRDLADEGLIARRKRQYRNASKLPPVAVLEVLPPDASGDLWAKALEWEGEGDGPRIALIPRPGDPALGAGARVLARMTEIEGEGEDEAGDDTGDDAGDRDRDYDARVIRVIGRAAEKIVGIFRKGAEGGRIVPVEKGDTKEWQVPAGATLDAKDGELVEAERSGPKTRLGLPRARIVNRVGDPTAPRAVSLIAIHSYGIPDDFPQEALDEADAEKPAAMDGREDLTSLPFVTIDPADARDHDDACLVAPDPEKGNPGGFVLWVAIADVASYVRPGSALDREARRRGNSTYFPDRVVPMLPDRLSGDLCSLHEGVTRPVLAVRMRVDAEGRKIGHRFTRAMIRSAASLEYVQVQEAHEGRPDAQAEPLLETVIEPLYGCYEVLKLARERRQPLDLDLPERQIVLDDKGKVVSVRFKDRLDAHRLIEEFMVLANVAAAEELERLGRPLLYRVHEEPAPDKIESLREVARASGFGLAKGQVLSPAHLNRLLHQAAGTEFDELLNISTLRAMTQAYYTPEHLGHFGLALKSYAHFTSPIRRYSDLIVHRALISGHGWGKDGLSKADIDSLEETAQKISETERRSMAAERDTTDRYLAAYLADRVGSEFGGRVSGVQRFGVFVKLDETGADGLIPVRALGQEFFRYDPEEQRLEGTETGLTIGIGQRVRVKLSEAVPVTGGLELELLELDGVDMSRSASGHRRKPFRPGRKMAALKARKRGVERKVKRSRKPR